MLGEGKSTDPIQVFFSVTSHSQCKKKSVAKVIDPRISTQRRPRGPPGLREGGLDPQDSGMPVLYPTDRTAARNFF